MSVLITTDGAHEPLLQQTSCEKEEQPLPHDILDHSTSVTYTTTANFIKYIRNKSVLKISTRSPKYHNDRQDCSALLPQAVRKRKSVMVFLMFLGIIIYAYSSMVASNLAEEIPVIHHSHVPGMKELKSFASSALGEKQNAMSIVTNATEGTTEQYVDDKRRHSATTHNIISSNSSNSNNLLPSGYLVWSDKCQIQNIDPYSPDVMEYFKRQKYDACSNQLPLTHVKYNQTSQKYSLILDETLVGHFTKSGGQLSCCYHSIERSGEGKKADREVKLSKCLSFTKSISIPPTTDNILVKCRSKKQETYVNVHSMMPERPEIRARLNAWKENGTRPLSVLMIGIDSISRVNLIRAMPNTAQYLYDNEWFEMAGYNKMDDNTFPNLMAILTGFNSDRAFKQCAPTRVGALDACPLLWKTFRENGYITAYAEDEASISTFNYLKVGFEKPPTDYYLRPLLLQAEKSLPSKKKSGLTFCLGYQHEADYIYDYALELGSRYKKHPYFGLFWANTFSHNAISDCSAMDEKIVDYLKKLKTQGILDDAMVIFFSDHGMRFGPTRKLPSGHLEERLPFMFIWLPPWVKETHPEFVNGLSVNKNRLTNPYDLHVTLKHVLKLSDRIADISPAPDCPNCQTLLKPVPHSRSCEEISIEDHWCTCMTYSSIHKSSAIVKKVAKFAVNYINNYVQTFKNGSVENICAKLHLESVHSAFRSVTMQKPSGHEESYRVTIITKPNDAQFEATVRYAPSSKDMKITGQISRLDSYSYDSRCIADGGAKKYCSCK